ncbi:MAG TPA: MFS transporter, partial [Ktedonobacteraceae bacterium]
MATAAPRKEGFLTLLRKRNFLLLWMAQLISMTVLGASNFALLAMISNLAGKSAPFLQALAVIAFSLPAVLIGAPAGVFVDRRNKRSVLFYSNCLRALVTFGYVIALIINQTQLVPGYLMIFLVSAIGQFFTPAEGASIAMLVSEDELMHALSLFQVTFMISNALGLVILAPLLMLFLPSITVAGLFIPSFALLYLIMALLYLVCSGLVALIPRRNFIELKQRKTKTGVLAAESLSAWQTIWHEMLQAWAFIRRRPTLFEAVIQISFAGVLLQLIGVLAFPVVTDLLLKKPAFVPVVFAPAGVGLVLSSLFMPRIVKALGKSRTIFIGCIALALLIAFVPLTLLLTSQMKQHGMQVDLLQVVAVDVIMFLAGIALNMVNLPSSTAMQEQTPEWIKGRVLALQLVLYNACSIPVLLFSGGIAGLFSISTVLYVLAVCIALFGFWGFFYERKPHPGALKE